MAGKLKFAAFIPCALLVWVATAMAQEEDEIPHLKLDSTLTLPEVIQPESQAESPATDVEQSMSDSTMTNEMPTMAATPVKRVTGSVTVGAAYAHLDHPSFEYGKFSNDLGFPLTDFHEILNENGYNLFRITPWGKLKIRNPTKSMLIPGNYLALYYGTNQ